MKHRICVALAPALLCLGLFSPADARAEQLVDDAKPGDTVSWHQDLKAAFAQAKESQKILMVCVNAKQVEGEKVERAAKGLREVVYLDLRFVTQSRDFVCALLGTGGSSGDYGELRALGIDGAITSPQHIFIHPNGASILHRVRFWSHGTGDKAVLALLKMMDKARAKLAAANAPGNDAAPPAEGVPDQAADARLVWIQEMIKKVLEGNGEIRKQALDQLIAADKDGDCIDRLILLVPAQKKNVPVLVALIRALGRDQLHAAALTIADQLKHKEVEVRANAGVSLEYIGSKEKKVISGLRKAADKEKDPVIANHYYRALGRCGVDDKKTLAQLLKKADAGKSEFASYGPTIALSYFVKQKKAARGVEGILKKIGIPGSRRGGGTNVVKRGLVSWTLSEIGDPKSETFVREELLDRLKNVKAFWVGGLRMFWEAVARKCAGDESVGNGVAQGVGGFVRYARDGELSRYGAETRGLMDEYRTERDNGKFTPNGDGILGGGE